MELVKYHREPKNHMFVRAIWKGFMHDYAVAFEVNANDKLTKIASRVQISAVSEDVKTTIVYTPECSTSVNAVRWDGRRTAVL